MDSLYHATREFTGFDPGKDTTGLGFFLTGDIDEAFERFCTGDDSVVIEFAPSFGSPADLEEVIERAVRARKVPLRLGELRRTAEAGGYTIAEAACRCDFGRAFNEAVRDYAIAKGHDALVVDDWVIALDTGKLSVVRMYDATGGEVEPAPAPAP